MVDTVQEAKNILNAPNPKEKQIKKITKIYKYNFGWTRKTMFKFITDHFPELLVDVPSWALKNYNMSALYAVMNKEQLSNVIQILEQIEKRNHKK